MQAQLAERRYRYNFTLLALQQRQKCLYGVNFQNHAGSFNMCLCCGDRGTPDAYLACSEAAMRTGSVEL